MDYEEVIALADELIELECDFVDIEELVAEYLGDTSSSNIAERHWG